MKMWQVLLILFGVLILTGVVVVNIDLSIKEKNSAKNNIIQIGNNNFSVTEFFVDDKCYKYYDGGNKAFSLPCDD